jgi:DNA-binding NtrC family response regulator
MSSVKIFVVEDDIWYSQMLTHHLSLNPDNEVSCFLTGKACLDNLYKKPHIITLDYSLPDTKGELILEKIKQISPDTQVIIVSGQEDVKIALQLLKKGAYDYIVKDEDTKERLWNTIIKISETLNLKKEIEQLQCEVVKKYDFSAIRGNSEAIKQVFSLMEKAIKTNIIVSVTGETGTGKELIAKAIHYNSERRNKPFIAVNVTAIPNNLIESELFGYEKGAFTGANSRKTGKFEDANGGTLFLDEIGEMDLNMQSKLLRVLQERELTRVGGNQIVKLDIRLIVATHKVLIDEVKKGNFRDDLYYRLLGLPIDLPPLRYRDSDALLLAKHFVDTFCKENNIPPLTLSKGALEKLNRYNYPGNIRELKAIVELAAVMANGEEIEPDDITFNKAVSTSDFLVDEITLEQYNQKIIRNYLKRYNNNVVQVAQKLNIGKSTIYRMLQNNEL